VLEAIGSALQLDEAERAHPLVGDMTLAFEALDLPADPGLSLLTYMAEPGSPSEAALRELADWTKTRAKLSATRAGSER
jgi:hypothetical protein